MYSTDYKPQTSDLTPQICITKEDFPLENFRKYLESSLSRHQSFSAQRHMCLYGQIQSDILLETVFFMMAPCVQASIISSLCNSLASQHSLNPLGNMNLFLHSHSNLWRSMSCDRWPLTYDGLS